MKLKFQKEIHQQIFSIFTSLIIPCYYDYQMIYLVTKQATGLLLLAHIWINISSILCANLFFRFGGTTQQKRDSIFGLYMTMIMTGLIIYLLSIPAITSNPMGCIMFVVLTYLITEMLINNLLNLSKNFQTFFIKNKN